ncbi:E3 ubiquitin-protein ligase rnf146-like [Anneissia japonica]|uniref:E3 ubiquitin-protein ligase rnf146-like n=1 Tax=Anneissia japonica TaxID=1529436 RepID=UPI0014258E9E|nr:E3 ubiquitin-protein ligase rnf146-like [Anneissia japonica]XP_033100747.1 E3 ubiquitin-protein ligase rnf146-like [Anneissia japonica]XP_033100748.1 E3 ubiquitin-protein ligase rnf146-like [Anneissia japonica]XP_033100749.1 E3 ubiquitin-protein ligase rnf146-like [Anneissia japonica]
MTAKLEAFSSDNILECSVCLQTCIYPVELPCRHIFCFLCVKGAANRSKRCALCRKEIPVDYFNHPRLVKISKELQGNENEETAHVEKYTWYYEGRNGWWQYDERTNEELEKGYAEEKESIEILIAGFLYIIDFENMVQMRRNDPTRQRIIKRDLICAPKKGVAGLKMQKTVKVEQKRSSCDGGDDGGSDTTPTVSKSNSDVSTDPIYASSLEFTNSDGAPEYSTISNPANELSSHTFHPVSTNTPHNYVNSDGDYPQPDWDQSSYQTNSSGYTSMVSTRSSMSESLSSDNPDLLYENLRSEIAGSAPQNNIAQLANPDASSTNTSQPSRKISRNAKKRSGRMFSNDEQVELPTPSVYDSVKMAPASYLNDRKAEPLPTPMNFVGQMSGLNINDNPRRQSARQMTRARAAVPELIPPPLPKRTNSLTSTNPQKVQEDGTESTHGPGRAVRQNQRKDSKPNVTHV